MVKALDRPRVLIVAGRLDLGGAERHLSLLLPGLRAQGVDAELFVLERGGELEAGVVASGVPISGINRRSSGLASLMFSALALFSKFRTMRPDVVHFFLPKPYLLGSLVAILAGQRRRFMSRRSLTHYHRNHPWLAVLEFQMHRGTMALLGNSKAVVDELVAETGTPSRIGLIHNGVDVAPPADDKMKRDVRQSLGLSENAFVIAIVANLIDYKGHADLLDALGSIAPKLPQPWHLLVVGRDEGVGPNLMAQAVQLDIAPNISWLGERQDVQPLWSIADLGVLASHQEGFSNALIEAMAAGVPMVATAIGGNLDAVVDGVSGRLVPVSDPKAIAQAILELAQDVTLRQTMGRNAQERAVTLFSQAACVERYVRIYRGMVRLPQISVQSLIDGVS